MTLSNTLRKIAARMDRGVGEVRQVSLTYPSFASAAATCGHGYSDPDLANAVLTKTLAAMRKPWPDLEWNQGAGLYVAIPYVAARMPGRPLRVLDVGGSFGAHGMICARMFPEFPLTWAVVESPAFANVAGPVETNSLRVFSSTEDAIDWLGGGVDLVHSSGTLQYLEEPDRSARALASIGAPFILWQRMAFAHKDRVVVVQTSKLSDNGMGPLPPGFKDRTVSYPATYVTERELLAACEGYRVVIRVPSSEPLHGNLATFGTVLLLTHLPDDVN